MARRTRYYQGMIDMDLLRKGVYYDDLRQTYIIFICTFDLFGMDERIYTFRNQCMEQPELELGDGTTKIFLNAKGLKGRVDEDLEDFLQYVDGKPARSRFTQEMAQEVESVKRQDEMRREFVTLYMEYQKQRREGAAEGFERGRREGREEGIAEGRTEGRMIGTMRTALKFMNAGTPLKTAAKIADVPEEELRDFAKRNGVSIL
ncbi:Rpn family recombination-promoting nuclease/putative transposase [Centipeda periodontii]|nr:Rpn family recombination-promoting nuclease/putative transposase [Centipeda periodontii]